MMAGRGALQRAAAESMWRSGVVAGLAVLLAALSMAPLLDRAWWLPATAAGVAAVVAAGCLARGLRLAPPLQPVAQAVALALTTTVMFARDQAVGGVLPGPGALVRLRDLAASGRTFAEETVPPAGPDQGLLLLIVAGVGLIALAVDTLAVGVDLPGLTLVPLAALFAVPWTIAGSASGWAFAVVALAWLAILSSTQQDRASRWSPRARAGSPAAAALVGAAAISMALAAGSLVPTDSPRGPFRVGSGTGAGGSVEVQALVSLRRSLIDNDDRTLISYSTSAQVGDYLRLAVLEQFDGSQWRPTPAVPGAQPPAGPGGGAMGTGTGPLTDYRMDVGPLAGSTIPSPTGTVAVPNDWPIVWDQRSGLPARADGRSIEDSRIALVTAPPQVDAATLRRASRQPTAAGAQPPEPTTANPEPMIGQRLPELARQVAGDASTPFDAAVALQRWLTVDGGFSYSTDIAGGADEDALDDFLDERVGYCEQFSATMALMARSLGIPARLVVGFTQGRREGDRWVVRGTDAHAWPELWLGTAGWVRFEPTPGAPTTVSPAYSRPGQDQAPTQAPTDEPTPAAVPSQGQEPLPLDDPGQAGQLGAQPDRVPVLPIVGTLVALLLAIPALIRASRRLRRRRRGDAESAYREVVDTMVDLGLGAEAATPRATLAGVGALLPGSIGTAGHGTGAGTGTGEGTVTYAGAGHDTGAGAGHGTGADGGTGEGTGDAGAGPLGGDPARRALERIRDAVERARYGPPSRRGPAGPARAVTLAEREATPGGALDPEVHALRQSLARRAGRGRRMRAALWPRSVTTSLARRLRPRQPAADPHMP